MRNISELMDTDKGELKQLINTLLTRGCIMHEKVEAATGHYKENPDYDLCANWKDELEELLQMFGYSLNCDIDREIFYIQSEKWSGTLSKEMTYALLVLAVMFDEKKQQAPLNAITTTWQEFRVKAGDMGLLTENMKSQKFLKDTCRFLKSNSVMVYAGSADQLNEVSPLYITEFIQIIVNGERISQLAKEGKDYAAA